MHSRLAVCMACSVEGQKFSIKYCISALERALLGHESSSGSYKDSKANEVSKVAETLGRDGKLVL